MEMTASQTQCAHQFFLVEKEHRAGIWTAFVICLRCALGKLVSAKE